MGHLLYLMFRCDGKFGKFEEVGGTKHSRRERQGIQVFSAAVLSLKKLGELNTAAEKT